MILNAILLGLSNLFEWLSEKVLLDIPDSVCWFFDILIIGAVLVGFVSIAT
jgi:hypothetical protein